MIRACDEQVEIYGVRVVELEDGDGHTLVVGGINSDGGDSLP